MFEGVEDGAVEVCLNVSGRITEGRNYSVTILGDPIRSPDGTYNLLVEIYYSTSCTAFKYITTQKSGPSCSCMLK